MKNRVLLFLSLSILSLLGALIVSAPSVNASSVYDSGIRLTDNIYVSSPNGVYNVDITNDYHDVLTNIAPSCFNANSLLYALDNGGDVAVSQIIDGGFGTGVASVSFMWNEVSGSLNNYWIDDGAGRIRVLADGNTSNFHTLVIYLQDSGTFNYRGCDINYSSSQPYISTSQQYANTSSLNYYTFFFAY